MAVQAEGQASGMTAKRLAQLGRIIVSVLSMGFIFPHAIAEGLDGDDKAGVSAEANKG